MHQRLAGTNKSVGERHEEGEFPRDANPNPPNGKRKLHALYALLCMLASLVGFGRLDASIDRSDYTEPFTRNSSSRSGAANASPPSSESLPTESNGSRARSWPGPSAERNIHIEDYRIRNPSQILLRDNLYEADGLRLNLTMGCSQEVAYGVGNALARIYAARLLAIATNSTFSFHCNGLSARRADVCSLPDGNACLLSQFEMDTSEPESPASLGPSSRNLPSANDVRSLIESCDGRFPHMLPNCIGIISDVMVRDVRDVAFRAAKVRGLVPDDAAIHFRCGDVLRFDTNDTGYGLVPHSYYVERIPPNVTSISILTQPFQREYVRKWDRSYERWCKRIVLDLRNYLEESFPNATVRIRNDVNESETSYTAFVRLVLARKAAFCGLSSFCTSAVLATMAERGYVYETVHATWAIHALEQSENVEYVKGGPILLAKGKSIEEILQMLRTTKLGRKW